VNLACGVNVTCDITQKCSLLQTNIRPKFIKLSKFHTLNINVRNTSFNAHPLLTSRTDINAFHIALRKKQYFAQHTRMSLPAQTVVINIFYNSERKSLVQNGTGSVVAGIWH